VKLGLSVWGKPFRVQNGLNIQNWTGHELWLWVNPEQELYRNNSHGQNLPCNEWPGFESQQGQGFFSLLAWPDWL
jgi:hypothetical protein